ncbi:unknown [Clostridium sp. CAG:470]|nr:MAG: hypothetical protein BHW03_04695 [Clostridium sp. 28_17]CDE14673.1 unknown [Clostridium sp. CAG:470]
MKRLLRIASNLAIFSFIPILSWFCLGLLVDKNLVNVFTLTYPLQFIFALLKSIFATGANISKEKDKDENAVLSGMTAGTVVGLIIFGLFAINAKKYVEFMNIDFEIYKEFAVYSILQLYIQSVFSFVLEKLYFDGEEKKANKYCIQLNLLNFIVLIITAIFTKNKMIIAGITLMAIFVYVLVVAIKQYKKFKFELHIIKYIKYESVEIANNILFFLIFLFGLSNAMEFGEKYTVALNFVALITDTQWDSFEAISTVAKIDISKNEFNYKEHRNNAYKLDVILMVTTFIMLLISYGFYKLDLGITLIYLSFELINFIIYPVYKIKTCYLQLTKFAKEITTNEITAGILRFFISLLKTPYCTGIGQVTSSLYQFLTVNIMFNKNFKIDKEGKVLEK